MKTAKEQRKDAEARAARKQALKQRIAEIVRKDVAALQESLTEKLPKK